MYLLIRRSQITKPRYDGLFATNHPRGHVALFTILGLDVFTIQIFHHLPHHIFLVASSQPSLPLCRPISGALQPFPDPSFPQRKTYQFGNMNFGARYLIITSKGSNYQLASNETSGLFASLSSWGMSSLLQNAAATRAEMEEKEGLKFKRGLFIYISFSPNV